MSEEKTAQELVLIRRRSHDEEEHGHTGLWKIAYADFMTALMAFFLVMWLVNAANKKTLQQVATYFNPVRMSDQVTSEKGLNNLAGQEKPSEGEDQEKVEPSDGAIAPKKEPETDAKISTADEQGIFRDPYGLLSELSEKATTFRRGEEQVPEGGSKNTEHDVYSGGEGYRDPFDPDFRAEPGKAEALPSDPPVADGSEAQTDGPPPMAVVMPPQAQPAVPAVQAEASATEKALAGVAKSGAGAADQMDTRAGDPAVKGKPPGTSPASSPEVSLAELQEQADKAHAQRMETAEQAQELQKRIQQIKADAKTAIPNLEVAATPEGIMVSLTDDAKFGMFAVGSAKPRPELVAVMERISGLLKDMPGDVVVRGHTDGRPYRSKDYDNWRLSSARAHMAYYMLARGGIAEARIDRIEGHADRHLKIAADPNAAQNRRIEILIKSGQP